MEGPFDFAEVVRSHHRRAQAALHADTNDGRKVQAEYERAIGPNRNLRILGPATLPSYRPEASWAMAVVVGRGSDLSPVAEWARRAAADSEERMRFYLLPRVDIVRAFAPWYAEGFDDPRTADARDWKALHPSFGLFFANTVYLDAKIHPEWFAPKRRGV